MYEEAIKAAPPVGAYVSTPDGNGNVIEIKPLAAEVKVRINENDKDTEKFYPIKNLKILRLPQKKEAKQESAKED